MSDLDAALRERASHKETSVAIERIVFGAHQSDPVSLRSFDYSINAILEVPIGRHPFVISYSIKIEFLLSGAPS